LESKNQSPKKNSDTIAIAGQESAITTTEAINNRDRLGAKEVIERIRHNPTMENPSSFPTNVVAGKGAQIQK